VEKRERYQAHEEELESKGEATTLYSASVEERETVGCFLELYEISSSQGRHNRLLWSVYHLGSLPNLHPSRPEGKWIAFDEGVAHQTRCALSSKESFLQLAKLV
jgi:hypothetical protein